jgi:DNA-directed RNA polymerase specialized sigma24 family protein
VIATDPEDVAGETWVQVVSGLRRFRGGEQDFRAWLFTIARNRAADAGRSRARRPAVPLAMTELDLTEAAQLTTSPGAPPEIHGLARMLAAVAGPAEPGDLPGQAAALAAFSRLAPPRAGRCGRGIRQRAARLDSALRARGARRAGAGS